VAGEVETGLYFMGVRGTTPSLYDATAAAVA